MPGIRPTVEKVERRAVAVLGTGATTYAALSRAFSSASRPLLWEALTTSPRIVVTEAERGGHVVRLR